MFYGIFRDAICKTFYVKVSAACRVSVSLSPCPPPNQQFCSVITWGENKKGRCPSGTGTQDRCVSNLTVWKSVQA